MSNCGRSPSVKCSLRCRTHSDAGAITGVLHVYDEEPATGGSGNTENAREFLDQKLRLQTGPGMHDGQGATAYHLNLRFADLRSEAPMAVSTGARSGNFDHFFPDILTTSALVARGLIAARDLSP
jgi:hypothetical protein